MKNLFIISILVLVIVIGGCANQTPPVQTTDTQDQQTQTQDVTSESKEITLDDFKAAGFQTEGYRKEISNERSIMFQETTGTAVTVSENHYNVLFYPKSNMGNYVYYFKGANPTFLLDECNVGEKCFTYKKGNRYELILFNNDMMVLVSVKATDENRASLLVLAEIIDPKI
ncbi:hypothetical protein J4468_01340 [Candidatus Woesearchaeota archaeon]|nr:hypothetical protein [Candidatus Woesearchaeota archaeon]